MEIVTLPWTAAFEFWPFGILPRARKDLESRSLNGGSYKDPLVV